MPRNARNAAGGGRFYLWGRERYWSVTTILKALPKDALKFWAAKTVAEFAVAEAHIWMGMTTDRAIDYLKREPLRFTGDRADVGSAVHKVAEALALGRPAPPFRSLEERQMTRAFIDWARTMRPTWEVTEASVYHRDQRYAGTLDTIVTIPLEVLDELGRHPWEAREGRDSVTLIGDYKTGGDVEEGRGIYPEVALQLNAYGNAQFIGLGNGREAPLPELDGAFALHLGPAGWRMVPVRLGPDIFRAFLYVREVFRWLEVTSKDVLGVPLERIFVLDVDEDDIEPPAPAAPPSPPSPPPAPAPPKAAAAAKKPRKTTAKKG